MPFISYSFPLELNAIFVSSEDKTQFSSDAKKHSVCAMILYIITDSLILLQLTSAPHTSLTVNAFSVISIERCSKLLSRSPDS